MMVDDLYWSSKAAFRVEQSETFPAICGVTGTRFHSDLAGNSTSRPNPTRYSNSVFQLGPESL